MIFSIYPSSFAHYPPCIAVTIFLLSALIINIANCTEWSLEDNVTSMTSHKYDRKVCETVNDHLCKDIGWNKTVMPNIFNQVSQNQASRELHQYAALIKLNCSDNIKLFLCALYFPPCTQLESTIKPCRSVCIAARNGCEKLLANFRLDWPQSLDCSSFPDKQPCVSRDGGPSITDTSSMTASDKSGSGSDFIPLVTRERFICPVHFSTPAELGYVFRLNGKFHHGCGTPCDNFIFDNRTRDTIRRFILFFATICLLSIAYTLTTYKLSEEKFDYPQRALVYIAICYLFISLVFIMGFFLGDQIACNKPFPPPYPNVLMIRTLTQGIHKPMCTLSFVILIYAQNASFFWFLILCFTWFLTTFFLWTPEALEQKSGIFHALVWGFAALRTVFYVSVKSIQGDVLSGVCSLTLWDQGKWLSVLGSVSVINLAVCILFFVMSFTSSCKIRQAHRIVGRITVGMDRLLYQLTVFSIIYILSTLILITCYAYEGINIDHWILSWQMRVCRNPNYGIPCPIEISGRQPSKPNAIFFAIKFGAQFLPGVILFCLFISRKDSESWTTFLQKSSKLWTKKSPKPSNLTIGLDSLHSKP